MNNMQRAKEKARAMGLPVYPLYAVTASYKTTGGVKTHATYYLRRATMAELDTYAKVETCANRRRRVFRGIDGIQVTVKPIDTEGCTTPQIVNNRLHRKFARVILYLRKHKHGAIK